MSKISPVSHPKFTSLPGPSMYNYSCFKTKSKSTGVPIPKKIITMWLQHVKSACQKWRVPQNIRRALPPTYHIELGLNHTKLRYVDGQAAEPTKLPFYPIVDHIFGELSRQSSMIMSIPPEERDIQINLLLLLMDGEKVEQHETELQMQSFVSEAQTPRSTPENKPLEIEDDMSSDSTEEDIDVLFKGITELYFEHPHIQKKLLQRAFII